MNINDFNPLQVEQEGDTGRWVLYIADPRQPDLSFVVFHRGTKEDCEMLKEFGNELLQINLALSS
ncbi:MAG: hypothetical protein EBR82_00180 [Caulobacteraceae bacterium]|nr:hypothetical protein [Caulobacteraceae bacterium]